MTIDYAEFLAPSRQWLPLLKKGAVYINEPANRVCWRESGQFADRLFPIQGAQLSRELANLPTNVGAADSAVAASKSLSQLKPAIDALQLVSTVGALASVANLAVSCAGFALVMQRLARIDGKLDTILGSLDHIRQAVEDLHMRADALSIARLHTASESLSRSLAAESAESRRTLAGDARRLFQESRKLYVELWRRTDPWRAADVPLASALELQGRYVASAIGEIQAEFVLGDEGTFRHASSSCAAEMRESMTLDAGSALRARSDAASRGGPMHLAHFGSGMPQLVEALQVAGASTDWTWKRLEAFSADMEMARALSLEPWQVARIIQSASDGDVYLLGPQGHARDWPK